MAGEGARPFALVLIEMLLGGFLERNCK